MKAKVMYSEGQGRGEMVVPVEEHQKLQMEIRELEEIVVLCEKPPLDVKEAGKSLKRIIKHLEVKELQKQNAKLKSLLSTASTCIKPTSSFSKEARIKNEIEQTLKK